MTSKVSSGKTANREESKLKNKWVLERIF